MFCWHNIRKEPLSRGIRRPVAQGIHNSYCAGVGPYSQHICAHRSFAIGIGDLEHRMLRRWGFAVVVAVVEHTMEPAAETIEHKMATAAVVAHREGFAVDTGSFGMEVA